MSYVQNPLSDDFHESRTYSLAIEHMELLEDPSQTNGGMSYQMVETMGYVKEMFPYLGGICDIGCGNGGFLKVAQQEGIPVFGVDVNPDAIEATRSRGIPAALSEDVIQRGLGELKSPMLFTMRQLIEHVRDVRNLIEWIDIVRICIKICCCGNHEKQ